MGLAKILSSLLPSDVRENVLGDLAERGYRLSDILNVLPRLWFSRLRRAISYASVSGTGDAAFERRYHQFSRESGRTMALIYLLWASVMTIVDQTVWYLLIVLAGIAIWTYFRSSLQFLSKVKPGLRTWRELHIDRLRRQRASAVGIWVVMVCLDVLARSSAIRNGRTWPITAPHLELNLPDLALNISISVLILFSLHLLWAYRIDRELRQLINSPLTSTR